jgi:eukaryotic-like serine/threonine-protein kinase
VSHPAIVTIYDVGREGDLAFIAMELVEGRELRQIIREGGLAATRALEIAALVADGLAYAHERGVIHRDIKPGNIMVLPDGRVKIMDFGIARLQESDVKTQSGVLLGSPQYMSPEQVAGHRLDGRADVFSLGVVLYEMLTGVKPFDATDLTQLLFWVVNLPHKPPSERNPFLPPVIDYIVARALKKNPESGTRRLPSSRATCATASPRWSRRPPPRRRAARHGPMRCCRRSPRFPKRGRAVTFPSGSSCARLRGSIPPRQSRACLSCPRP